MSTSAPATVSIPGALGLTLRLLASAGVFEAHDNLWAHTELSRLLFDRQEVVADVAPRERMRIQSGDFFKESPPAVDAYVVSRVLHDWADTEAVAILLTT